MTLNQLRAALLDQELNEIIRSYYRAQAEKLISFPLEELDGAEAETLVDATYRLFCVASLSYKQANFNVCCEGAEKFKEFLQNLCDENGLQALRSLGSWEEHLVQQANENAAWSLPQKIAYRMVPSFKGVGLKTCCLLLKILCKDLDFFRDFEENDRLFVPVERVNVRMLWYFAFHLQDLDPQHQELQCLAHRSNYSIVEHEAFHRIGEEILHMEPDQLIYLDHLWFIGHFYHENMRNARRALAEGETVYPICTKRKAIQATDYAYFSETNNLPQECPFRRFNCCYDLDNNQQAINTEAEIRNLQEQ